MSVAVGLLRGWVLEGAVRSYEGMLMTGCGVEPGRPVGRDRTQPVQAAQCVLAAQRSNGVRVTVAYQTGRRAGGLA